MMVQFIRKWGRIGEGTIMNLPSHTANVVVKQRYANKYQESDKSMAKKKKRKNLRRRTTVAATTAATAAEE